MKFVLVCGSLLFLVGYAGAGAHCPPNWLSNEQYCYLFSHDALSWFNAAISCREHGAWLAEIVSSNDGNFIRRVAIDTIKHYWLGGRDDQVEGKWEWSSGTSFKYTDWRYGQPDNYGNAEDCVGVYSEGWFDEVCTKAFYYICQKKETLSSHG